MDQDQHDRFLETAGAQDFNFDEIDARLIDESPDEAECQQLKELLASGENASEVASALKTLLEFLLPEKLRNDSPRTLGLRVICTCWLLQSAKGDLGSLSLAEIARQLGMTRASLSWHVIALEKAFNIHGRGQMPVEARESFCAGAEKGWQTRRAKQSA